MNDTLPFFRQKHPVTISFTLGILLFFLPFAEIKCASVTLASNTGLGIAIGTEWNVALADTTKNLLGEMSDKEKIDKSLGDIGPNIFAIVSIISGLAGLAFYLTKNRHKNLISMCAGIIAAIMLIAVMIAFNISISNALNDDSRTETVNAGVRKIIGIKFTFWYYISVISFILAAFLSYKHYKNELDDQIAATVDFDFLRQSDQQGTSQL